MQTEAKTYEKVWLKRARISGPTSIRDTEAHFEPGINILIGKNGGGKTNFAVAILTCADLHTFKPAREYYPLEEIELMVDNGHGLEEHKILWERSQEYHSPKKVAKDVTTFSATSQVVLTHWLNGQKTKLFKKKEEGGIVAGASVEIWSEFRKKVKINYFDIVLFPFHLPENLEYIATPETVTFNADHWPQLKHLPVHSPRMLTVLHKTMVSYFYQKKIDSKAFNEAREQFTIEVNNQFQEKFEDYLSRFTPVKKIAIRGKQLNMGVGAWRVPTLQNVQFEFLVNDYWHSWDMLSDGTKRILLLITEVLSYDSGIFIIEEPELGIHPHQLHDLLQFIKEQSENKQFIITTHAPQVLDILDDDELTKINIVEMTEEGTKIRKLTEEQQQKARNYIEETGTLSDYWMYSDLES